MQKSNWTNYKLSDIADVRDGTHNSPKEVIGGGFPLVTSRHIYNGKVDLSNTYKIAEKDFIDINKRSKVDQGDILISMIGTVGQLAYIAEKPLYAIKNVGLIKPFDKSISKYIFYYLISPFAQAGISTRLKGTTQQYLSLGELRNFPIYLPPLDEQKRIAEFLGAFDDKIELLQKQNKTLEEMAKATFKSWFVDFDVVKAKASLRSAESVPLVGKVREAGKGVNKPAHQPYSKSIKCLVRLMRQHLTSQEVKLWQYLRKEQLGFKFRRQYPINDKYIADFVCLEKKLIIELDGSQHVENKQDIIRTEYLQELGFSVLRFWNTEIDNNLMGCLEVIKAALTTPHRPAATSPAGGEDNGWTKEKIMREYHLTEQLYDLFPSSFTDSSLGPIPLGWQVRHLTDIAEITMGQSPAGTTYNEKREGIPFYQGRSDFGFRYPMPRVYCTAPTRFADIGDTLISVRAPVGDINRAIEVCCIGRGVASLRHRDNLSTFLYYLLLSIKPKLALFNTEGTVFGSINRKDLSNIQVCVAIKEIVKAFEIMFQSFDNKILINTKQIQILTEMRDALLPRLISGKIRV